MADRTPDTDVLDQDDPPTDSSGTEPEPGADLKRESSGQSPEEPTSGSESES
ncbi:MAG: hypothetical protein HOZ81_42665, partial [Streptomyces sp.]|nr:hypothetical protein [Streptomyces sp.]